MLRRDVNRHKERIGIFLLGNRQDRCGNFGVQSAGCSVASAIRIAIPVTWPTISASVP